MKKLLLMIVVVALETSCAGRKTMDFWDTADYGVPQRESEREIVEVTPNAVTTLNKDR